MEQREEVLWAEGRTGEKESIHSYSCINVSSFCRSIATRPREREREKKELSERLKKSEMTLMREKKKGNRVKVIKWCHFCVYVLSCMAASLQQRQKGKRG